MSKGICMNWTLGEMAAAISDARLIGSGATQVARIHTDTRSLQAGDLYLAIAGDKFDGNSMLAQAKTAGAVAAIAHARHGDGLADLSFDGIEVPDTRRALGELGKAWRQRFAGPLIAVTGSNGKTTVTQMIASILRAHAGAGAHATRNSFNNDIGLPLTLLALRAEHTYAVVEIGMNHVGEIAQLAALALPTVSLVNNAQREHQEFMGTVDAVAQENAQVFAHTRVGGYAVFPASDAYTQTWRELAQARGLKAITFGSGGEFSLLPPSAAADEKGAQRLHIRTPAGELECLLAMPGQHNASNALAAAACAWCAGIALPAIEQGLSAFQAVSGRSRFAQLKGALKHLVLIDDSYNANPDSVRAAIDVLNTQPKPQKLILGDMGEVGSQGPEFHAEIGAYAAAKGINTLWVCGELAKHAASAFAAAGGAQAASFPDAQAASAQLGEAHALRGTVLVKGSRFMRMERVVQALEALDQTEQSHIAATAAGKESHAA